MPYHQKRSGYATDPQGSLSAVVPSSRIETVNKLVQPIIDEQINPGTCSSSSGEDVKYFRQMRRPK